MTDLTEKHSSFPKGTNDDDVYEMLILGELRASCCQCGNEEVVSPENDTYKCSRCGCEQTIPTLNPKEAYLYEE